MNNLYQEAFESVKKRINEQPDDIKVLMMGIVDLAKLAAETPQFYNPVLVNEVKKFRNYILSHQP